MSIVTSIVAVRFEFSVHSTIHYLCRLIMNYEQSLYENYMLDWSEKHKHTISVNDAFVSNLEVVE